MDTNQNEPGYSKKMVWLMLLLIVLAGVGLIWIILPKNSNINGGLNSNNTSGSNNTADEGNNTQTGGNNDQTTDGSGGTTGIDTSTPPLDPIRDVTTTTTSTANPAPDSPPGEVNPNTGVNNSPPVADNPQGGIRP